MVKLLKEFIDRGGAWFFSSSLFERITRLSLSIFVFSELSKDDSAVWSSALIMISIFIPVKSLGIESGILQYAGQLKRVEQNAIFKYFFSKGFLYSFLFSALCALIAFNKKLEFTDSKLLIYVLCFWLPTSFLFEFLLSYTRILKDHKLYAKIQTLYNCIYAILLILGFWLFGLLGFALAFVFSPLITFLIYYPEFMKSQSPNWKDLDFEQRDIIFYGLKTSFTNYASILLFYTDMLLIEYILNSKEGLSDYRVSTIIPLNLGFFAIIYVNNDYVHLVDNKENTEYLKSYLKKYYKLFFTFTLLVGSVLYFSSDLIWVEYYKNGKYSNSAEYFELLLIASMAIILLRIPAGNILSAIGKVHINTITSYFTLIFNLVISYLLMDIYGLKGIALGTVISLTFSGTLSIVMLYYYLNKSVDNV